MAVTNLTVGPSRDVAIATPQIHREPATSIGSQALANAWLLSSVLFFAPRGRLAKSGGFWQRRSLRRKSNRLLLSLGDTADAIAHHLLQVGARGVPQDPFECVLSRYLNAVMPTTTGIEEVAVGKIGKRSGSVQLILRLTAFPRWTVRVNLAEHVQEFLLRFDAGSYPDLVREGRLYELFGE